MKVLLTALLIFSTYISDAQTVQYDVAINFSSIGAGTPSEEFLLKFYKKQKKTFKRIQAFKAGGCGREGEFSILMNTKGMKVADKTVFYKKLKALVLAEEKKNLLNNTSSGHITMTRKVMSDEFAHCRAGIIKWPEISSK